MSECREEVVYAYKLNIRVARFKSYDLAIIPVCPII